jgi:hypothetical protein
VEHAVAQGDGLTHGLEADADVGQAGDGERARDRAGRHDDHVVGQLARGALGRLEGDDAFVVAHLRDGAVEYAHLGEDPPQRGHQVTRREVTRRRLRQEGLVGHVGLGVDDRDAHLTTAQLPMEFALQPERCVQADVSTADNQYVLVHPEAPSLVECL